MLKRLFKRGPEPQLSVLMVCMGNICRSPMAEGVLRGKLQQAGMADLVRVDSAGTHGFHRGAAPDPRAIAQAGRRGWRLDGQKSRPVVEADFSRFDLLLAMDADNLAALRERCPEPSADRLGLLLDHAPWLDSREVPDPYYGAVAGFDLALDLIEPACDGLLRQLRRRLGLPA
ncbi:low molecular weight protein-tyrosine-phosphatase [Ideonella sp. DXS22W]|uniref:protein-tyrosine-phosphatase n=1 Tax=Pseudaquabacterium inlustre TaxID=2984192 RepID=A0ABU9CPS7_9BURK